MMNLEVTRVAEIFRGGKIFDKDCKKRLDIWMAV